MLRSLIVTTLVLSVAQPAAASNTQPPLSDFLYLNDQLAVVKLNTWIIDDSLQKKESFFCTGETKFDYGSDPVLAPFRNNDSTSAEVVIQAIRITDTSTTQQGADRRLKVDLEKTMWMPQFGAFMYCVTIGWWNDKVLKADPGSFHVEIDALLVVGVGNAVQARPISAFVDVGDGDTTVAVTNTFTDQPYSGSFPTDNNILLGMTGFDVRATNANALGDPFQQLTVGLSPTGTRPSPDSVYFEAHCNSPKSPLGECEIRGVALQIAGFADPEPICTSTSTSPSADIPDWHGFCSLPCIPGVTTSVGEMPLLTEITMTRNSSSNLLSAIMGFKTWYRPSPGTFVWDWQNDLDPGLVDRLIGANICYFEH